MARETSSSASASRSCTGWRRSTESLAREQVLELLRSGIHEDRMLALLILVRQATKADEAERKAIYDLYLAHTRFVNNWDLVDASAPTIVGGYLVDRSRKPLDRLAGSRSLWERRISIVATLHFIREAISPTRSGSPSACWATGRT